MSDTPTDWQTAALDDALAHAAKLPKQVVNALLRILNDPNGGDDSRIERIGEVFARHYARELGKRFGGG